MNSYWEKRIGTVDLKDTLCCPDCYGSVSSHGEG